MRTKALALEVGMLNGPYNEEKGIRRVRTPAGAKRFGQPIGSIIIADGVGGAGKKLVNLKIVDSEYEGFDKVKGKNGKTLYIGKYDGERNYTVNDADDNELYSARSLEDAFKWADKNSAPKSSGTTKKPSSGGAATPSKADVKKFTTLSDQLIDRTGELASEHKPKLHGPWRDYVNNDPEIMDIQDQLDEIMERYGQEAEWRGGFWHYPSPEAFAGDSGSAPKPKPKTPTTTSSGRKRIPNTAATREKTYFVGKGKTIAKQTGLKFNTDRRGNLSLQHPDSGQFLTVAAKQGGGGWILQLKRSLNGNYGGFQYEVDTAEHAMQLIEKFAVGKMPTNAGIEEKGADMGHQYKTVTLAGLKADHEAEGVVESFVAITGIKDNVNDIIMPGAFQKSLVKRTPKGVWHHNITESVSKTLAVEELPPGHKSLPKTLPNGDPWPSNAGGLLVKTMFNLNTQRGRDAYEDVKFFGEDQEWSIGYNVPQGGATIDRKTGVRKIHHLDLYEYSPVLFGAMPNARTVSVKSAQLAWKQLDGLSDESLMEFKNLLSEVESKSLDDYKNFDADTYESKADDEDEDDLTESIDEEVEEDLEDDPWDDEEELDEEKSFYDLSSADLLVIEGAMSSLNELKELLTKAKIDPSKKFKKKKTIDEEAEDDDEKVVTKKVKKKVVDEDAEDDIESDEEDSEDDEDTDDEGDSDGEGEDGEGDAKVTALVESAGLDVSEEAQSFDKAVDSNDIQVMEESGSLILDAVEEALNKGDADKPALEELAGYIASAFQSVGADGDPNTTEDQGGSDEEDADPKVEEEETKKKLVKKHDPYLTMEGKAAYVDYDFGYQLKRSFDQSTRDKLADNGHALPDGSFPIENESDLKNAIQALGRAKDKGRAKAHIEKRAKALGKTSLLPDGWHEKAFMEKSSGFVLDTKSIMAALEDL